MKNFTCPKCLSVYSKCVVPLLVCSHFICPPCYVKEKQCGNTKCQQCGKQLRRRCRK